MIQDFFTALQFLTRLQFVTQTTWSPESFGRSVKYFPAVGAVIGVILAAVAYISAPYVPPAVLAAGLIALEIILTGGLHGDGLMDTADGIFSGRSQERMLEIMKDSRTGANGVMAFVLVALMKWSLLMELAAPTRTAALLIMPVLSRFAMVAAITLFPYARPEGIGKAFAQYAGKQSLVFASVVTIMAVAACSLTAWVSLGAVLLFVLLFGSYVKKILGGLTGDVYGAITETSNLIVLAVYLVV